jgi:hypothetical protein
MHINVNDVYVFFARIKHSRAKNLDYCHGYFASIGTIYTFGGTKTDWLKKHTIAGSQSFA